MCQFHEKLHLKYERTIFVTLNLKWFRPFVCYEEGIYPKHEGIYVVSIRSKVNQQHDHPLTRYKPKKKNLDIFHRRKTLTFGFILDRDASKQIRPCPGSHAPARNILIIETQTDFKWQMWCH